MPPKARPSRGAAGDAQVVARIGKPHGIRGEVTVQLHTDDPGGRFTPGTIFPTRAPAGSGTPKALTVRSARDHNGIWLLGFEEIPDRTGAEGLRGALLLLPAEAPEVEDDAWYADDLVGLRAERPDGSPVGTVTGLVVGAAQDRLVLDLAGGGTAEVPFVRALVPVVDVPGGRVVVDPPEGLLEAGLMRIDVVTIFPAYLEPLRLSLIGSAQAAGLLALRVHDLREHTHDRHRTVDDTPYGGGAGMVMRPEPWGEALDAIRGSEAPPAVPHLVVPSPAGERFTQAHARVLAAEPWLVFACGRYEGIDERVIEEAAEHGPVSVLSLGDYVLNGGEVAALAMVEAIARLIPGVVGNSESLVEESHEGGLLEHPVYTKPATWRGHAVPEVLRSGDHARIAAWRRAESLRRTAARRPDLVPPAQVGDITDLAIVPSVPADAPELLVLQRCCWLGEGRVNDTWDIPPLVETLDDVRASSSVWRTWVVRSHGRLIASVRGRVDEDGTWEVGRLMVAPDWQGRGLGRVLLEYAEQAAPPEVTDLWLITGAQSARNIRLYKRAGYRVVLGSPYPGTVLMRKRRR